jgi:predicted transcriptional regulator
MQTISITVDDQLLQAVSITADKLDMTLSAFMQYALQLALKRQQIRELEEQHRQGYLKKPVTEGEFNDWEGEQVWGD